MIFFFALSLYLSSDFHYQLSEYIPGILDHLPCIENYHLIITSTSLYNLIIFQGYWTSYLYITLVGREVLNVTVPEYGKRVRMYAHCTNREK